MRVLNHLKLLVADFSNFIAPAKLNRVLVTESNHVGYYVVFGAKLYVQPGSCRTVVMCSHTGLDHFVSRRMFHSWEETLIIHATAAHMYGYRYYE